jgi:hypothetical protein
MKTILTIFAGRKPNLEILVKYLKLALEWKIIDEVHLWNNTRNGGDEEYVKSIGNMKRSCSSYEGNYIPVFTPIVNNSFSFKVRAPGNIHIKMTDRENTEYQIILGGWDNQKSIILKNNVTISELWKKGVAETYRDVEIRVVFENARVKVYKNNEVLMECDTQEPFFIGDVFLKTGYGSVGHFTYETIKNHHFYFMDTCEKNWKNYYMHYDDAKYSEDVIIKCDDDIVFIDLCKLPAFIEFIRTNDYDLVFANTINNGVSAFFQQHRYHLIPKEYMELEFPHYGGSLWESGKKAEILHNHFLNNSREFLEYPYHKEIIPIESRFSINFFGYKGKHWKRIANCFVDDELNLTVDYLDKYQFKNVLYSEFFVSHLSFYRQIETGIHLEDLIRKYDSFYDRNVGRFVSFFWNLCKIEMA